MVIHWGRFTLILGYELNLIVEDTTVTVECSTAIQVLFLYFNLYQSINEIVSRVLLHSYPFLLHKQYT
jgi:hypothetical protein